MIILVECGGVVGGRMVVELLVEEWWWSCEEWSSCGGVDWRKI